VAKARGKRNGSRGRGRRAAGSRETGGRGAAKSRSNQALAIGSFVLVMAGWAAGRVSPLSWVLSAFFGAALFGAWYPDRLRRSRDQHKTLASQVQLGDRWKGTGNVPLADTAAFALLALWIAFLWMGMDRFPEPQLVSAAVGGLWATVGMVLRSAWVVWRRGAGWVPPDPKIVTAAAAALKTRGRDRSRWSTLVVGLVAVQAAAGQVLMAGTFGVEVISWDLDRVLGSILVALAGYEVLWMLMVHRLLPVADRVAGMQALLRSSSGSETADKDQS